MSYSVFTHRLAVTADVIYPTHNMVISFNYTFKSNLKSHQRLTFQYHWLV